MIAILFSILFSLTTPLFAQAPAPCTTPAFAESVGLNTQLPANSNYHDIRAGDLNGDGMDDLVLVSSFENSVRVFLNSGFGTFFPRGVSPIRVRGVEAVALADFDLDGRLDLAVKEVYTASVSILLGSGDGTFQPTSTFSSAYSDAVGFEVGDIEGDGRPDLFARPTRYAVLSPFQNLGGGQFRAYPETPTPIFATAFSIGDFNKDGFADAAIAGAASIQEFPNAVPRSIVLLRGDGQGGFAPFGDGSGPFAGDYPIDSVVADFNRDGNLDVIVLSVSRYFFSSVESEDEGELRLFFGNGSGQLTPGSVVHIPFRPAALEKGDFDLDGRIDVAVDGRDIRKFAIVRNNNDASLAVQRIFEQPYDPELRFHFLTPANLLLAGQFAPGPGIDLLDYSRVPAGEAFRAEGWVYANSCPLDITLAADTPATVAGTDVTYRLRLANVSRSQEVTGITAVSTDFSYLTALSVTASAPGECRLSASTVSCTPGSLGPGETFEAEVQARLSATHEGLVEKFFTIRGSNYGPYTEMSVHRGVFGVDLTVAASPSRQVAVRGEELVHQVTVRNAGTEPASGVELIQELPDGARLVSAPGCTQGAPPNTDSLSCLLGDLAAQEIREFAVTLAVESAPGEVRLASEISVTDAADAETFPNDNTVETSIPIVAPGIQASNASFEDGALGAWQSTGSGEPAVLQFGHFGDWAVRLHSGSSVTQHVGGLQPGQFYSISGWARSSNPNFFTAARLEVVDPAAGSLVSDGFRGFSDRWSRMQVFFRAGAGGVARITLLGTGQANDGTDWDDIEITAVPLRVLSVPSSFPTIQEAIEAAADGDRIVVAPGLYRENLDFLGKAIIVESRDGPEATTVDGGLDGPGVSFVNGEPSSALLRGMHIRNSTPGVYIEGSSPTIRGNRIWDNQQPGGGPGGGIAVESGSPSIEGNSIDNNRAGSGGGIYIRRGQAVIRDNTISNNEASGFGGGGLWVVASEALIERNAIQGNVSLRDGGGLHLQAGQSRVRNNRILANRASWDGGGIAVSGVPRIEQNLISGNIATSGSGAAVNAGQFLQNTLAANESPSGSALLIEGPVVVRNNIVAGSSSTQAVACPGTQRAEFTGNLVFAGSGVPFFECSPAFAGVTVLADPLFRNAAMGDYRLSNGSRAIDAGSAIDSSPLDIDGRPRIVDGDRDGEARIDIGAFEWQPPPPMPPRVRVQ